MKACKLSLLSALIATSFSELVAQPHHRACISLFGILELGVGSQILTVCPKCERLHSWYEAFESSMSELTTT